MIVLDRSHKKIVSSFNYAADANLVVDKIGDLTRLDILVKRVIVKNCRYTTYCNTSHQRER